MKTPREAKNQILASLIKSMGYNEAMDMCEDLRLREVFDTPEYYSRLKRDFREMCTQEEDKSDLVIELDKKIDEVKMYYR